MGETRKFMTISNAAIISQTLNNKRCFASTVYPAHDITSNKTKSYKQIKNYQPPPRYYKSISNKVVQIVQKATLMVVLALVLTKIIMPGHFKQRMKTTE